MGYFVSASLPTTIYGSTASTGHQTGGVSVSVFYALKQIALAHQSLLCLLITTIPFPQLNFYVGGLICMVYGINLLPGSFLPWWSLAEIVLPQLLMLLCIALVVFSQVTVLFHPQFDLALIGTRLSPRTSYAAPFRKFYLYPASQLHCIRGIAFAAAAQLTSSINESLMC